MDTTYDNIDTSQKNQNGGIAWSRLSMMTNNPVKHGNVQICKLLQF